MLPDEPRARNWRLDPPARNKEILAAYFEERPVARSNDEALKRVASRCKCSKDRAAAVVEKSLAREEAKKQRREYADQLYGERIPVLQSIVGKGSLAVDNFLTTFRPQNLYEAEALTRMIASMANLLRLELGKSTNNVEIIHKTHKNLTTIMKELKENDPFVDYEQIEDKISGSKG